MTKITSKQFKVIDTVDFNGNAIENALINAMDNTITGLQTSDIENLDANLEGIATEIDGLSNNITNLQTQVVTNSGSSLPSVEGYNFGDTFLNTSDKKLYTVDNGYKLNDGVINYATVDFVTGIVNGFGTTGSSPTIRHYIAKSGYTLGEFNGSKTYRVHFKLNSVPSDNVKYGLFCCSTRSNEIGNKNTAFYIKNKKIYAIQNETEGGNVSVNVIDRIVIDYEISANIEYYLEIVKNNNGTCSAALSTSNYNAEILSINTFELGDWYGTYGSEPSIFAFGVATGETYSESMYNTFLSNGQIYLLDSSGEFLVTDLAILAWNRGTALENAKQYADATNRKLYYYLTNTLLSLVTETY